MRKFYLVRYEVEATENNLATRMLEDKEFETEEERFEEGQLPHPDGGGLFREEQEQLVD